jgi:hypothetical protein
MRDHNLLLAPTIATSPKEMRIVSIYQLVSRFELGKVPVQSSKYSVKTAVNTLPPPNTISSDQRVNLSKPWSRSFGIELGLVLNPLVDASLLHTSVCDDFASTRSTI